MINEKQLAMFGNCLGVEGLKMCNSLSFAHEETRMISTILTKMDLQIVGELNETYERYIFNLRNQRSDESIDEYVTESKHLSKNCNFCDCLCDSLLRDKLVMGIVDKETRKKLLQMKKLTLELCIDTFVLTKLLRHKLQLFLMQLLFIGLGPLNQNLHKNNINLMS